MLRLFHHTVSAISYDIARAHTDAHSPWIGPFNDVTAFVLASWGRMPRFLAWPLRLATIGFSVTAVLSSGSLYHRLEPTRRAIVLASWRNSRIGACRNLIRFYDSLAVLAFYSRTAGTPDSTQGPHSTQGDLGRLRDTLKRMEVHHG